MDFITNVIEFCFNDHSFLFDIYLEATEHFKNNN